MKSISLLPRTRVNYGFSDLWKAIFTSEKRYTYRHQCENVLSAYFDNENVCLTPSARDAIYELLIRLPQKTVVIPAYTCIAVVEAVLLANKTIVYAKTDENTFNADYLEYINKDTIVLATHQYGLPCKNISKIVEKCKDIGAILIEDCATSMGTIIDGKKTGTYGDFAVVSFNASKLLNVPPCGGLLMSKSKDMIDDIKKTAHWKTSNSSFKIKGLIRGLAFVITRNSYIYKIFHYLTIESKGKVQKTEHKKPSAFKTDLYLYQFSEWQAKILLPQLKEIDDIYKKRKFLYKYLDKHISNSLVKKPLVDDDAVCCRYAILVKNRNKFYHDCILKGIDMDFSHCNLGCPDVFSVEHQMANEILNVPFYYHISDKEIEKVVSVINSIR